MYLVGRPYCPETTNGTVLASHIMEHPQDYTGTPECMLKTLGAALWIRQGSRFYIESAQPLRFEDVVTDQLNNVIHSMDLLNRHIKSHGKADLLSPEIEDLVWSVLMKAASDNHVLTNSDQIIELAGWLRKGIHVAQSRWGDNEENVYKCFLVASSSLDALCEKYLSSEIPPRCQYKINVRTKIGSVTVERVI